MSTSAMQGDHNNVAGAEACLRAKFHLDPSSHLAIMHQDVYHTSAHGVALVQI